MLTSLLLDRFIRAGLEEASDHLDHVLDRLRARVAQPRKCLATIPCFDRPVADAFEQTDQQASVERRFDRGFYLLSNWTWSKGFDNAGGDGGAGAQAQVGGQATEEAAENGREGVDHRPDRLVDDREQGGEELAEQAGDGVEQGGPQQVDAGHRQLVAIPLDQATRLDHRGDRHHSPTTPSTACAGRESDHSQRERGPQDRPGVSRTCR